MIEDKVKIIQREPNNLNSVGSLVTFGERGQIQRESSLNPIIIPDVTEDKARLARLGIRVERVDLASLSADEQNNVLLQTADIYGRVFAGAPWFEEPLHVEEQAKILRLDLARPDTQLLLVINNDGEIKGFSWSYTITPSELVQEKWETSEMQTNVIEVLKTLDIQPDEPITYFAEAGINRELRGLGISNIFYAERLAGAKELGFPVLMRTKKGTKIPFLADRFGLKQIFGPVGEISRRDGTRAIEFSSDTYYGGIDTENEERTLYALSRVK